VGADDDPRPTLYESGERRQQSADAPVIGDASLVIEGSIEVGAQQDTPPLDASGEELRKKFHPQRAYSEAPT
jgi:hypothetical protein